MEEPIEEHRVVPELYFLIAKFLSGGPLKETAQTLLKELERVEVLPRRLDWEGAEHPQSYDELASRYEDLNWDRLVTVCKRALQLARDAGPAAALLPAPAAALLPALAESASIKPRLSLLGDSLVRDRPQYASFKLDHTLVRRLVNRETGLRGAAGPRGLPARLLSGLALQRRTLGHLSAVYCLALDPSGRYVVTGADDLLVKVWSATDGRLVSTLRGAGAEITDVAVTRDGALLAAGSVERLVRVWAVATAAPTAVLSAHQGTITSVQWGSEAVPGVRWLSSTSTDGSVAFWPLSTAGTQLSAATHFVERLRPGPCHMICASWSAGGAFLAAGSADHHVRVYQLPPAGAPTRVLETAVHSEAVDSLSWAHRGLRFVSGSKDGSAALWALHATQWRHRPLRPPQDAAKLKVTMVCWDCSDEYVLTALSDNTVRVWSARTCTELRSLSGHRDEAYVLEAHPFLAGVVLSAGHDGQLFVWDAPRGQTISKFQNWIPGQGEGALFDAKWSPEGVGVAAADSHGHLLMLGLGQGHRLLAHLPTELFFHTDYRPLVRDALGGALDEQTQTPPHLLPPPFLVDVEGAPHPPPLQRLVPGREQQPLDRLVPADARSRLDVMIEELAHAGTVPGAGGEPDARGPWRGSGVRRTAGWLDESAPARDRPLVPPLADAHLTDIQLKCQELYEWELSLWRREMRRRPLMISTGEPPRRAQRAPRAPRPRPRQTQQVQAPRPVSASPEPEGSSSGSDSTSDESVRLSGSPAPRRARRAPRAPRRRAPHTHSTDSDDTDVTYSESKTEESSESSPCSDWQAGAALAPPTRAKRRPRPARRYSPSAAATKRTTAGAPPNVPTTAGPVSPVPAGPAPASPAPAGPATPPAPAVPAAPIELSEAYRPAEWLCAVSPRKAPYYPQIGDRCLYFRLGHQRYFEAVAEKDVYKVNPRDKPWERTHVYECEDVKVVGIKYVIKPPRVACLRLACVTDSRTRVLTVRYHDMPDVIDFLVLRQHYDAAVARRWGPGDRFRCMIDDSWWTGVVVERSAPPPAAPPPAPCPASAAWAAAAAAHFLSLKVRWDNGELERLSPWDLEPIDPERLPMEPGGCVPVAPSELAALYRAEPADWPHGDRPAAAHAIATHIHQVMSLSAAEPFAAPVDLQRYPSYAYVVPYPVDLSTIKARFDNLFYRRAAAAMCDVRHLASNAERFNQPHSAIVRQARLVTDLLLYIISHWRDVDVVAKYHELAAAYHSSDDEPLSNQATKSRGTRRSRGAANDWRAECADVLRELMSSADAEPFKRPVDIDVVPDYHLVIAQPMDLGTIEQKLSSGEYSTPEQFLADVRRVFTNSRSYNTNKRSRIYSMTVRLSALFESLWARVLPRRGRTERNERGRTQRTERTERNGRSRRTGRTARSQRNAMHSTMNGTPTPSKLNQSESSDAALPVLTLRRDQSDSSDSETLAATSRRVRARSSDSDEPLRVHSKGKGVGKKSMRSWSPEPGPSTAGYAPIPESYSPARNGVDAEWGEEGASDSNQYLVEVLDEALLDDDAVDEDDDDMPLNDTRHRQSGRKRRPVSASSGSHRSIGHRHKRFRERFAGVSSSSSSSSCSSQSVRRYESDRSYRPRYSTDDDKPLTTLRLQREENSNEAGPSRARSKHNGHGKRRLMLRTRRPRRYNEESSDDAAAISKRRHRPKPGVLQRAPRAGPSTANDHNYINGHAHRDDAPPVGAVSVSSRGRVRKLTAKARGLLRE